MSKLVVERRRGQAWDLVCCDCGLVHRVRVEVKGRLVRLELTRDEGATKRERWRRRNEALRPNQPKRMVLKEERRNG